MKFDVVVVAIPKDGSAKPKKYLLAKKELNTERHDEIIADLENIYLPMEKQLLKVTEFLAS